MSAMRVEPGPRGRPVRTAASAAVWPPEPMAWALGLRNPTADYEGTRHNAGADALREVSKQHGALFEMDKSLGSQVSKVGLVGLALPLCWMNESALAGGPVGKRARGHGVVVVFHDDIELDPGEARLKFAGGYAGHNGLRSLGSCWGGPDFARVRIGVGRPEKHGSGMTVADWALSRPSMEHAIGMALAFDRIGKAFPALSDGRWAEAAAIIQG